MYSTRPGLVLGFHGCDKSVVENVITGTTAMKNSENDYDWLGHGVYFWENSPARALEFAKHLKKHPQKSKNPIKEPAVLGAVLNLGYCLDLLDYENLLLLKDGYILLGLSQDLLELPRNKQVGNSDDLLLRNLDCAVIETLHGMREAGNHQPYDSVRGVFWEGKELYPNAGFREKDHIQLCIRNPNCIKGFFLPRTLSDSFPKV